MEDRNQIIKILNKFMSTYNLDNVCGYWIDEERGDDSEIWVYIVLDIDFVKKAQVPPGKFGQGMRSKLRTDIKKWLGIDVMVGSTAKKCDENDEEEKVKNYSITESQYKFLTVDNNFS